MQKLSFKLPLISIIVSAVLLMGTGEINAQEAVQQNQMKFGRLLRLISSYYVDSANVEKLTEDAIVHILGELDPHSTYISKEDVEKMNEPLQGNFEGIGISFNIFKDSLLVTAVIAGGPSEKVGLLAGDRIIEIDQKKITGIGLKNSDVYDLLRGKKGTTVGLKVIRKAKNETLDFSVVRDKIPIYSLDASYMLDETTGYIKLNKFSATTTEEFLEAMTDLKKQNIKNLVLDLRGNTGGYLNTAIELTDQFLNSNKMIVYTNGENEPQREYKSTQAGTFIDGNLVVLVDESSASASEIVSGAIQDWDRGLIIGRRTYGKGLVQRPFYLTDGSVVRLTTAHYFTPSGRNIQKPYIDGVAEYRQDYRNRIDNGEMFSAEKISITDSLAYKTMVNGRTVFGGGGIVPDIFIPLDTSSYYQYINQFRRTNNIIYNYVLDYIDSNRQRISENNTDFKKFDKEFTVTDKMVDELIAIGEKEGIVKNEVSLNFTRNEFKKEIKSLIARDLFTRNEFYKVYYQDDEAIVKALEVIKNQPRYNNLLVSKD
jgi:carboxyl-terminal processing protease